MNELYSKNNKCCCIVLNYNDAQSTIDFVDSIKDYSEIDHIIVVDNCSSDNSLEKLEAIASSKTDVISTPHNGGYGYGNNFGVRNAKAKGNYDLVLISNPDVFFTNDTVNKMKKEFIKSSQVAAVSPLQRTEDGRLIADYSWDIPSSKEYICSNTRLVNLYGSSKPKLDFESDEGIQVDCVPGALLMVRTDFFLAVDGYDEDMFLYCEETTLGIKFKNSHYRTILLQGASYQHQQSVTISKSFRSSLARLKLLEDSRRIVLTRYLHASEFDLMLHSLMYKYKCMKVKIKRVLS